jgi:hypothetical protein
MLLKVHFLHSHLDFSPENLGEVSDKQGEHCHQGTKSKEYCYQGSWNDFVVADYCRMLYRNAPDLLYHGMRKS